MSTLLVVMTMSYRWFIEHATGTERRLRASGTNIAVPFFYTLRVQLFRAKRRKDLTSETLLAVFHRIHTFRGIASNSSTSPSVDAPDSGASCPHENAHTLCTFNSFVFSIAKNQLRQWLRRKHVRDQQTTAVSHASHPADSQEGVSAEWRAADATADPLFTLLRREHLDSACYALAGVGMRSSEQFKALLLHYACGLAHKDVAALLGTRKETINARLQDGRVTLKAHFTGHLES